MKKPRSFRDTIVMSDSDHILLNKHENVATVTFNRPDQRNAISYEMWQTISSIMRDSDEDNEVRCIVFRGAGGKAFSAGADIKDFDEHRYDSKSAAVYAEAFEGALEIIENCSKPTVSAIQGFCVGGGLELAAATDIRIVAESSKFGVPVAKLGLTAGWDELRRMISVAGVAAVKYMLLSGRIIEIDDAERFGIVTSRVSDEDFNGAVDDLARQIAGGAPLAARDHKIMIGRLAKNPDTASLTDEEFALQFRVFDSDDFREGVRAFKQKRRAEFIGE